MTKTAHGNIHGRTIELLEDLGLAEGQAVEVRVRVVPQTSHKSAEGFLRTEGALADDPHWDSIMEEIYHERKQDSRQEAQE